MREGIVALLELFIDTVVICTMTALVIVITGAYNNPAYADLIEGSAPHHLACDGGERLLVSVRTLASRLPLRLLDHDLLVVLWASGAGPGCSAIHTSGLLGLFLLFVFLGSIIPNVLDFGDLMILGMAFPNVLGVVILSGNVKRSWTTHWGKKKWASCRFMRSAAVDYAGTTAGRFGPADPVDDGTNE